MCRAPQFRNLNYTKVTLVVPKTPNNKNGALVTRFTNVSPKNYAITSGTDRNNAEKFYWQWERRGKAYRCVRACVVGKVLWVGGWSRWLGAVPARVRGGARAATCAWIGSLNHHHHHHHHHHESITPIALFPLQSSTSAPR